MKAILHCDKEWGIGRKNDLMFHLPLDMAYFRKTTLNKVVVMGSNTLLSFPSAKPLKNRVNIVLWPGGDRKKAQEEGFIITESIKELFNELKKYPSDDIFIIGGAMMYKTMLPYCNEVLVTKVDAVGNAEVFFENLDKNKAWRLEREGEWIMDNGYNISFCSYINSSPKEL